MVACGRGAAAGAALRVAHQTDGLRSLLAASGQLEGLPYEIEFSKFAFGPAIVEALGAGHADTGEVGSTPPIFGAAAQTNFRVVATKTLSNQQDSSLLVRPGSGIRTGADLVGARITVPKGSSAHGFLPRLLHREGIALDRVQLVFLAPADGLAAFEGGEADAWAVWEPFVSQRTQAGIISIAGGPPDEYGLGFEVASRVALEDPAKVAALRDYVRRKRLALDWAGQNLDQFARAWAAEANLPLPVARGAVPATVAALRATTDADIDVQQNLADRLFADRVLPQRVEFRMLVEGGVA